MIRAGTTSNVYLLVLSSQHVLCVAVNVARKYHSAIEDEKVKMSTVVFVSSFEMRKKLICFQRAILFD